MREGRQVGVQLDANGGWGDQARSLEDFRVGRTGADASGDGEDLHTGKKTLASTGRIPAIISDAASPMTSLPSTVNSIEPQLATVASTWKGLTDLLDSEGDGGIESRRPGRAQGRRRGREKGQTKRGRDDDRRAHGGDRQEPR
jgi:hypothetical protein